MVGIVIGNNGQRRYLTGVYGYDAIEFLRSPMSLCSLSKSGARIVSTSIARQILLKRTKL
jgi:hypothetical protein